MLFVYPQYNYELTGLNCGERKELIHEATMLMTKNILMHMAVFKIQAPAKVKILYIHKIIKM